MPTTEDTIRQIERARTTLDTAITALDNVVRALQQVGFGGSSAQLSRHVDHMYKVLDDERFEGGLLQIMDLLQEEMREGKKMDIDKAIQAKDWKLVAKLERHLAQNTPAQISEMLKKRIQSARDFKNMMRGTDFNTAFVISDFFRADLPKLRSLYERLMKRKEDFETTLSQYLRQAEEDLRQAEQAQSVSGMEPYRKLPQLRR